MGWRHRENPKTVKLTKALAKEFVDMDAAPHDRPLSNRRLEVYAKLLAAGHFRPVTWAKAYCRETKTVYRVNGKHTSILFAGLDKLPDLYVNIEDYYCDTLEDVAQLYSTFDSGVMTRTALDIYLAFASTQPELAMVANKTITLGVTALAIEKYGSDGAARKQPAERAELMLDEVPFFAWLQEVLFACAGGNAKHPLKRAAVVHAMLLTWRKAKGAATEFWKAVRDETDPSPTLPTRKLARYLNQVTLHGGKGGAGKQMVPAREMFVKSLHAWNAWRKNESTDLKYYPAAKVPTPS